MRLDWVHLTLFGHVFLRETLHKAHSCVRKPLDKFNEMEQNALGLKRLGYFLLDMLS